MVALALTENEANSASSTARGGFLETEPWKRRKGQLILAKGLGLF